MYDSSAEPFNEKTFQNTLNRQTFITVVKYIRAYCIVARSLPRNRFWLYRKHEVSRARSASNNKISYFILTCRENVSIYSDFILIVSRENRLSTERLPILQKRFYFDVFVTIYYDVFLIIDNAKIKFHIFLKHLYIFFISLETKYFCHNTWCRLNSSMERGNVRAWDVMNIYLFYICKKSRWKACGFSHAYYDFIRLYGWFIFQFICKCMRWVKSRCVLREEKI